MMIPSNSDPLNGTGNTPKTMNEIKTTEELAPLMLRLLIAQNAAARAKRLAKSNKHKP